MLDIYHENGFKLFQCYQDKTAFEWKNPSRHLTLEAAKTLQETGELIGAWIPDDIIVIDLGRYNGHSNGVNSFQHIKEKYDINYDITSRTFCVVTNNRGYHIYLRVGKNHKFTDGGKAEGIKVMTDFTYVITAGSPGYSIHPNVIDYNISDMPVEITNWLNESDTEVKKERPDKSENYIPVSLLSKILKKLDIEDFQEQNRWYDFVAACQVAAGYTTDVKIELLEWSRGFKGWSDDAIRAALDMFTEHQGVTIGTFVKILRQHDISQYYIKKVLSYNISVELYESMRDDGNPLPFPEPDYNEISDSKEARELFLTGGNSVAATLLGYAISQYIIWCEADKSFFLFDGNKWSEYYDMFSITYTVLIRLAKFMYAKKKGSDVDNDNFIRLVKTINKTHWKRETVSELKCRDGVYHKKAIWDSFRIKETITTKDGVIDFTGNDVLIRSGERNEFRKSYINYTTDEIMKAGKPVKYNEFLSGLFPDEDTLFTATQASSMFITGNAKKVFQIYHGGGDNGKSTWIEIEAELLGDDKAYPYPTDILLTSKYGRDNLPPEAADFAGKYFLYGSEVLKGRELSLGKIKNFTGQDTFTARPLYKDPRIIYPTWQMILSVNDLPFFDGTDRAFINRLIVLPFERTFVENEEIRQEKIEKGADPEKTSLMIDGELLKSQIRKEFPAVIKQKIDIYLEMKNKYNGIIKQSALCRKHKDSYISDNNNVENFIVEMCKVGPASDYFVTSEDITNAYHEYMGSKKASVSYVIRQLIKSRAEIQKEIKIVPETFHNPDTHDYDTKKVQKRGLKNIRLKTIEEIEHDSIEHRQEEIQEKIQDDIPF
jgi:phage/plasmid-associated DNA primase